MTICPKHKVAMAETITDEVVCAICERHRLRELLKRTWRAIYQLNPAVDLRALNLEVQAEIGERQS